MGDCLQFLNDNSGVIQIVFSALVTAATVVYAMLTWRLVTETRHMRRAQTDAKVTITVEPRQEYLNFIDLRLRNEGLGPAYDVGFKVEVLGPDCDAEVLERVSGLGFVKHGLDYFSPNQEIRTFLVSLTDDFAFKMRTRIQVTVSYRTAIGDRVTDAYVLDFAAFEGIHQLGTPDLHQIAKSMKEISKDLHDVTRGFKKPQVITQDKADYRREQEESYARAVETREAQHAESEV